MQRAPLPRGVIELDLSPPFQNARHLLRDAEVQIRLIDRVQPTNAAAEQSALLTAWGSGAARAPRFEYQTRASLAGLRAALETLARGLSGLGPLGALYAARALELELEAALSESIDTPRFADLAARRYPVQASADDDAAVAWARDWVSAPDEPASGLHRSDDRADPSSLFCALLRAAHGLPVRVEIRPNQAAQASVGEGFIGVRPGLWHSDREVLRIVLHEIDGHVRPRVQARREELALFRIGSRGGNEDEEGRALLIERRARVLDGARRRELSRRHLAARDLRHGLTFVDTVTELLAFGHPLPEALDASSRAYRGGGLGREYVYLVGLARVSRVFEREPELEPWLKRGRISLEAARLCAAGLGF